MILKGKNNTLPWVPCLRKSTHYSANTNIGYEPSISPIFPKQTSFHENRLIDRKSFSLQKNSIKCRRNEIIKTLPFYNNK